MNQAGLLHMFCVEQSISISNGTLQVLAATKPLSGGRTHAREVWNSDGRSHRPQILMSFDPSLGSK